MNKTNGIKKVLYISRKSTRCGVQDYGERIVNIIKQSEKFQFSFCYPNNRSEMLGMISKYNPDAIFYNYHFNTLDWVRSPFTETLDIPQVAIYHESFLNFKPDGICVVDCTEKDDLSKNYVSLPRPLHDNLQQTIKIDFNKPVIGSFGFGFSNKNFPYIAQLVKEQFDEAILRLSIPFAEFGDNEGYSAKNEISKVHEILKDTKIELEVNHEFLSHQELFNFLSNNDINIFCYDIMPGRSIASSTDYALSVKKPIALSRSNMFNHFHKHNLKIYVDETPIKEIINNGISVLDPMYKEHCFSNILDKIETVINNAIQSKGKVNSWIKF